MDIRHFIGKHRFSGYEYNQLTEVVPTTPEEMSRREAIIGRLEESSWHLLSEFLPEQIVLNGNIPDKRLLAMINRQTEERITPKAEYL